MSDNKSAKPSSAAISTQVPVSILRSALFSSSASGPYRHDEKIISDKRLAGTQIFYTGPHLSQEHFKVWQALVYLAKLGSGLTGDIVYVSNFVQLLELCGRQTRDHKQYKKVFALMVDLTKANVQISTSRQAYSGSLVWEASREILGVGSRERPRVYFRMNGTLAQFLSNETLSNDIMRLASLGKDQLAAWLHNYYATQKVPPLLTVEELRLLSGSSLKLPQFKQRLKTAFPRLRDGAAPLIKNWRIDPSTDVVYVEKNPTVVDMRSPEAVRATEFEKWKAERALKGTAANSNWKRGVNSNRGQVVH